MKFAAFASAMTFSISAWAGPSQIEVIGLVPGETTQAQVDKIKLDSGFVIGGYRLICVDEYIDGFLSMFLCVTGEDYHSIDTTVASPRLASNTEVHAALLNGFVKKFGAPSKIESTTVRNRLGVEFGRNEAVWVDKKGNILTINSMASVQDMATNINEGMLLLESSQFLKKREAEREEAEQQRKF